MSSFKEFMDKPKASSIVSITCSSFQASIVNSLSSIIVPYVINDDEQQKLSEEISKVVQDDTFIRELSDRISEPRQDESEDEFIKRSSDVLRKMLYSNFDIKS